MNRTPGKILSELLRAPIYNFQKFHSLSALKYPFPLPETQKLKKRNKIAYKGFARFPLIKLPDPEIDFHFPLRDSLLNRTSIRHFSNRIVTEKQISTLLYYSAGKKKDSEKRFYPSAGAAYPLEIYLISRKTSLPPAVYHYYVRTHSLEKLFTYDNTELSNMMESKWKNAPCFILLSARFNRTVSIYRERGYRYILLEAGHLAQNIYLISQALNLSCCAIGGFSDHEINKILNLESIKEAVIYIMAIGHKA